MKRLIENKKDRATKQVSKEDRATKMLEAYQNLCCVVVRSLRDIWRCGQA